MRLKMCTTGKTFGKICLKTITDTFFPYVVCNQRRDGLRHEGKEEDSIFWCGMISNRRVRFKTLGMSESPILILHRKYLNNVIILKEWERKYIFLQSNKFTACKARDWKGVAKSLTVFNLRKIIHPFKNKKYIRT